MQDNVILNTDSYKSSHFLQYPDDTRALWAYISSRGGMYPKTLFFGLQYLLRRYLSRPVQMEDIAEAKELFALHGEPFNEAGWEYIVKHYCGFLPVEINAIPEGTLVPTGIPLVTVNSSDTNLFWLVSYLETLLLRVWYPTTVATRSFGIRQCILRYLEETSDAPAEQLPFKLHDFGARGVSSEESAGVGGMAHLVNFMGTDTVSALRYAREYYGEPMAGYSIPASEHSTITSWGREGELDAYRNMLRRFGGKGKIFTCVADSYNLYEAVEHLFGDSLRQEIIDSGGIVVIRPDSGNPVEVALATTKLLDSRFGSTRNGKGFKVLNSVRVIYGDGINESTIRGILMELKNHGYSADNVAFGMGGALLQQLDRDTNRFAMKTSAIARVKEDGRPYWQDVYKDPATDSSKQSLKGRVTAVVSPETGEYRVARVDDIPQGFVPAMRKVFSFGTLTAEETLQQIRERASTQA